MTVAVIPLHEMRCMIPWQKRFCGMTGAEWKDFTKTLSTIEDWENQE